MLTINYNSFGEFLSDAEKYKGKEDYTFGPEWYGNASYSQALKLAREGWPEGTLKIKDTSTKIVDKITSLIEIPEVVYDVIGLDYDMGMYLSGQPENWYNFQTRDVEVQGHRILRVIYNFGARAEVSPESMKARGFTCAALIRSLEFAGRRVELVAVNRVDTYADILDISIPVKSADQELDIDRLSFILAHPAMLRRLGFGVRKVRGGVGFGAGRSMDVELTEQGDVYFDAAIGATWTNPETAQAWILEQLKTQGVQFNEEIRPAA